MITEIKTEILKLIQKRQTLRSEIAKELNIKEEETPFWLFYYPLWTIHHMCCYLNDWELKIKLMAKERGYDETIVEQIQSKNLKGEWKNIEHFLKRAFIVEIMSAMEFSLRPLLKEKDKTLQLKKGFNVIRRILKYNQLNELKNESKNGWKCIIGLRNIIVHNNNIVNKSINGMSDNEVSSFFEEFGLEWQMGKEIQGDLISFIKVANWIFDELKPLYLFAFKRKRKFRKKKN